MLDPRTQILKELPKNSVGAEIGVHKGDFSAKILDIVDPKKLFLIDPWIVFDNDVYDQAWYGKNTTIQEMNNRYNYVKSRFKDTSSVEIIRETSINSIKFIEDSSLDFVYIDGDHTFEGTCLDFDLFYPKVKKGGFICGDDYHRGSWWKDGVIDALHLNLYKKKLKMHLLVKNQYCCQKLE
jgi:hypothetical protein